MLHVIGSILMFLLAVLGGIVLGICFCLMLLRGIGVGLGAIFHIFKGD